MRRSRLMKRKSLRIRQRRAVPRAPDPTEIAPSSGALVALAEAERRAPAPPRALAGFVAHLVACRDGAPDLRSRRRAEPAVATERYAAGRPRSRARLLTTC